MEITLKECAVLETVLSKLTCRNIVGENLVKVLTLKKECKEKIQIMDEATKSIVDEYDLPKTNDGGFKISGDKKDEIISKISDIEKQVVKLKSEPFLTFDELVSVSQNLIVHEIELCEKLLVKKPIEPKVKKVK